MRVLTPMLLRVGKESRSPISGPTFSLLSLQEGNNNTIAAAMMTAAMVIVCVNFFKCRNFCIYFPNGEDCLVRG